MNKITLFITLFSFSGWVQGQTPAEIQITQPAFIHVNDLANFDQEELALLKANYVVFDGELTEEKIHELVSTAAIHKINQGTVGQSLKPVDQQYVKEWLALHPEVKIVTRSLYSASSENIRNEYDKSRCLILSGEVVTREDILNY